MSTATDRTEEPTRGIRCSQCGCGHFQVVYTRHRTSPDRIERRRECRHCGKRITTWEKVIG